jgi:ABC-2 type transport system permease protein
MNRYGPIGSAARAVNRVLTQLGKELIVVRRRPGALLSLVLGPFLVLALFGIGYTGVHSPLRTVLVVPSGISMPRDIATYQDIAGPAVEIAGVTDQEAEARQLLADNRIDMLVVVPADAVQTFRAGNQVKLMVEVNEVDPVAVLYTDSVAGLMTKRINEEIVRQAVSQGESYALRSSGESVDLRPDVVAEPTVAQVENIAPVQPDIVGFAAPSVLALILQHMAVTLTALALIRERLSGTFELFRVSPVNALELIVARYLGLGLLTGLVAAASVALLVTGLGVPMLGSPLLIASVIGLLTFASLGLGLLISIVSDSERQAVQLALLLLIASVFFSGIMLPVGEFTPLVQTIAYLLPVTHGIVLLQDLFLRGAVFEPWVMVNLAVVGIVLLLVTTLLVRRQLQPSR